MNIHFTSDVSGHIPALIDFLRRHPHHFRLDYPDFDTWLDKAYTELALGGNKKAILCVEGGVIIGSLIYQEHPNFKYTVEIKNLTVDADEQRTGIGSFLLASLPSTIGDTFPCTEDVHVDVMRTNTKAILFFRKNQFIETRDSTLRGNECLSYFRPLW